MVSLISQGFPSFLLLSVAITLVRRAPNKQCKNVARASALFFARSRTNERRAYRGLQSRFPHHIPFFGHPCLSPLISASSMLQVFLSLSPVSGLATKEMRADLEFPPFQLLSVPPRGTVPSVPTGRAKPAHQEATGLSFTRHI